METGGSLRLLAVCLVYSMSSRAVRDPVSNKVDDTPEEDTQGYLLPYTHTFGPMYMHTYE